MAIGNAIADEATVDPATKLNNDIKMNGHAVIHITAKTTFH
jgi:hypothetical protein